MAPTPSNWESRNCPTETVFARNVIDGGSLYSIFVRGANSRVERNVVTNATSVGIQTDALNGRYAKNTVTGPDTFGFLVFGTGNRFVKNESTGNRRSDFASVPPESANTVNMNVFGRFEFDLKFK